MKYIILTLLLISSLCYAQYDPSIEWYDINFFKVTSGTPVSGAYHYTITSDTSLTFAWESGDESTPAYITQLVGEMVITLAVSNSPTLWVDGSASVTRDIVMDSGLYEITVDCGDINGNTSGYSQPIYLEIMKPSAKVVINLRIQ